MPILGRNRPAWPVLLVGLILMVLILDRGRLMAQFAMRYAEEDQTLLWCAAFDHLQSRFYEPCFYGQAYNSTLEALLAVPLLALHVPCPTALPVATIFLALVPFASLAGLAWIQGHRKTSAMVLLIPLLLPVPYAMVTCLPRGFVTGLAAAAITAAAWLAGPSKKGWFLGGLASVVSLTLNPNASILLLALGLWAWLTYWKRLGFYLISLLGAAVGGLYPWGIYQFYHQNPTYDLHRHKPLAFAWESVTKSFGQLDMFFGHFVPLSGPGWVALALVGLLIMALVVVRQYRGAVALLVTLGFVVFSLGINRVHLARGSVFFSGSRMYLAVPLLWALGIFWLAQGLARWRWWQRRSGAIFLAVVILAAGLIGYQEWTYTATLRKALRSPALTVEPVSQLEREAAVIAHAGRQYGADLVLFPDGRGRTLSYAIPALTGGQVESLFPPFERRTWRLEEETRRVRPRILVYAQDAPRVFFFARDAFSRVQLVSESPRLILVETDGKTAIEVAQILRIPIRPY